MIKTQPFHITTLEPAKNEQFITSSQQILPLQYTQVSTTFQTQPPSNMASSRIFIKGLPPNITEDEFKTHFGAKQEITDAKLIAHRRIGYIGYKTPEEASKAVKYFNKSFVRMSKIGVEIARPVSDAESFNCFQVFYLHHRRSQIQLYPYREKHNVSRNEKIVN